MAHALPGYMAIDEDYLLGENRSINFDIFIRQEINGRPKPILLIGKNTAISTVHSTLSAKKGKLGTLYVKKEADSDFQEFMEESLSLLITDPTVPVTKKSQIVYECAKNILEDVFEDPRSGKNLQRTQKITNNMVDFILANDKSILSLLNLGTHDYYTFSHCVNVAVFGLGLWIMIGRGEEFDLRDFALGCILHDVGKTLTPEQILKKPGRLDDQEFAEIKKHPQQGYALMKDALPPIALDVILHHHERYCGKGYPDGLTGNEISDHAKIAAIADVYDALTTNRPYGMARPPFDAILTMKKEMVGHFEQDKFLEFIRFLGGEKT
ncbi:MAG: HD-GYP domain-containing protein [Desulfobulbaceae bacterium]|nr:HD-GYP domain-containing protein [Desulfobulbaceae bacterium]